MSPFALKLHQKENKNFEKKLLFIIFQKIYAKIEGHCEHIQSPSTPSRKILFDPQKILQNGGKNTPSQNLGLASLLAVLLRHYRLTPGYIAERASCYGYSAERASCYLRRAVGPGFFFSPLC
jgi:hypothetical protein